MASLSQITAWMVAAPGVALLLLVVCLALTFRPAALLSMIRLALLFLLLLAITLAVSP